jgi:hypothetical protein
MPGRWPICTGRPGFRNPPRPGTIGLITPGAKLVGKPGAGKRHAEFNVAGAGNVVTGAALRASAKALEVPLHPNLGAPVPDPTDEGGLATVTMVRLVRHRQTKGAATDRPDLQSRYACSPLYHAMTSFLHPLPGSACSCASPLEGGRIIDRASPLRLASLTDA